MRWTQEDIKQYVKAKEYIDTAIIPLIPMRFDNDTKMTQLSFQKEVMSFYVKHIENQLKGRVFLFPEYYYIKNDKIAEEKNHLEQYIESIKTQPFNHIFLITFDNKWRKLIKEFDGVELLWIPSIQEGDLNHPETQKVIQSQVNEIQELITDNW